MPRSDEAEWWFNAVYDAVQQIPSGRVTSYGHIARLLGRPDRPRQVGVCLKHLPEDAAQFYHNGNVPWQRVLNSRGGISPRGPGSAARQATALRRERIVVDRDAMGGYSVNLGRYGWFPDALPSDAVAEADDGDEEDDDDGDEDDEVKSEVKDESDVEIKQEVD